MGSKVGRSSVLLLILFLASTGRGIPALCQQRREPVIGWLDLQRILQQTPGYAAAESVFNREIQPIQRDVDSRRARIDSIITAFGKQSAGMAEAAREVKRNEIQRLSQELEQSRTELEQRAQRRQRELMAPLEDRVRAIVEGVRAERNLAMIIDVSTPGPFLALDPSLDLTPTVVQRLRGGR